MVLEVDKPVAPVGNVQRYEDAPATGVTVNTCPDELRQTPFGPVISVGVGGDV